MELVSLADAGNGSPAVAVAVAGAAAVVAAAAGFAEIAPVAAVEELLRPVREWLERWVSAVLSAPS